MLNHELPRVKVAALELVRWPFATLPACGREPRSTRFASRNCKFAGAWFKRSSLSKNPRHLLGPASESWSGGACSQKLSDGRKIVILNPNHGPQRTNATLMEEISHVFLGHQPNRLKIVAQDERGRTVSRDYRKADEEAAYATGAAALVPYSALRTSLLEGQTSSEIAKHFRVSRELVEYRLKVTRLWPTYRRAHLDREIR